MIDLMAIVKSYPLPFHRITSRIKNKLERTMVDIPFDSILPKTREIDLLV